MFESVPLNESIPSPYLEKYEPQKGKKDYVFICSKQKWRTEIHYSDVLKTSFHCFGGSCCKVVPKKSFCTIYLIAQYNDRKNPDSGLVLKYLKAGKQLDDQIRNIADQFDDPSQLTQTDLMLTLDTSKGEKFKMVSVTPCVDGTCKAKGHTEALKDLKEQIKTFLPSLQQSVASVLNEEQFIALCEEHDIDVSDFDDVEETKKSTPKKVSKKVEEVEEPEEVEETEELEETEDEELEETEDEELEETEDKPKKVSTPVKKSEKDIPHTDFNLDDLL